MHERLPLGFLALRGGIEVRVREQPVARRIVGLRPRTPRAAARAARRSSASSSSASDTMSVPSGPGRNRFQRAITSPLRRVLHRRPQPVRVEAGDVGLALLDASRRDTTALPSSCTCAHEPRGLLARVAEQLLEHVHDVVMRLTGSFHTITIHGLSVTVDVSSIARLLGPRPASVTTRALTAARSARTPRRCGEQAVDEPAGVLGGVLLGELDRLADHDRRRDLGLPAELVGSRGAARARSTAGMRSSAQCSENLRSSASISARCSSTPRTSCTAYSSGGAGLLVEQRVDAEVAHLELVTRDRAPAPELRGGCR